MYRPESKEPTNVVFPMNNSARIKVAWLAPYPTEYLCDHVELQNSHVRLHPAIWIVNLALGLAENRNVDLHIVTLSQEISYNQTVKHEGITYHFLKRPRYLIRLATLFQLDKFQLHRALNTIRPDLVHCHGTEDVYSYAGVTSGFTCLISVQGIITEILRSRRNCFDKKTFAYFVSQFIERYTFRRGNFFVAKTAFVERFVRCLSPKAKIYHIENIVHQVFFQVERNVLESSPVLFIGSVLPEKGIEELIDSMTLLKDDFPLLRLKIIGPNNSKYVREVLQNRIYSLELENHIKFCGFKSSEEIANEFSSSLMLVLPSYMDTSPNVIAEAMVAGVPVIASRVGGIPFMIREGETGTLVTPKSSKALAERIRYLLTHPQKRELMAKHAMQVARQLHHPTSIVPKLIMAYEKTIQISKQKKYVS